MGAAVPRRCRCRLIRNHMCASSWCIISEITLLHSWDICMICYLVILTCYQLHCLQPLTAILATNAKYKRDIRKNPFTICWPSTYIDTHRPLLFGAARLQSTSNIMVAVRCQRPHCKEETVGGARFKTMCNPRLPNRRRGELLARR